MFLSTGWPIRVTRPLPDIGSPTRRSRPSFETGGRATGCSARRDITNATNERTVLASILPRYGTGGVHLIFPQTPQASPACLLANANALVFDYAARQKVGGSHLALFILEQLPVLPPSAWSVQSAWDIAVSYGEWIVRRVVELTYTAWDLADFARDHGWLGPPFRWDPARRYSLRVELDAALFHMYGVSRSEVDYILDTFPIVRRNDETSFGEYRTKRLVLEIYDAMADAIASGRAYQTRLDPPPGDPDAAHPPRPGAHAGRWVPADDLPTKSFDWPRRQPRPGALGRGDVSTSHGLRLDHEHLQNSAQMTQETLTDWAGEARVTGAWSPESVVDPSELILGMNVRHRSFGEGTILTVEREGRTTSLLVRFPDGEREIAFGYNILEYWI